MTPSEPQSGPPQTSPDREEATERPAPDEVELLTSPLARTSVGRVFIIGGPLGLAVAIFLSLWSSSLHVKYSVVVQVETQWLAGESLAVRAQIVPEQPVEIEEASGEAWVEQGGQRFVLPALTATARDGVVQATLAVPELEPGPARLGVRLRAKDVAPIEETIAIELAAARSARTGTRMVLSARLKHGDDTDAQPEGLRIDVRPAGRVLAGFENTLWVRVLQTDGTPHIGPVEVWLVSGEFMGRRGRAGEPVRLREVRTNRAGLAVLRGKLTSEVLRVEMRVIGGDTSAPPTHRRRVRLVSYPGAAQVEASVDAILPGQTLGVAAQGLSKTRPVYVDVHGPDGAWIGTFTPPFVGRGQSRRWAVPDVRGVVQFEAYNFTNVPGESTALDRVEVLPNHLGDSSSAGLGPLIAAQRKTLEQSHDERQFDPKLESAYLDHLVSARLGAQEVADARGWLLGTLPITVFGPPKALSTRERELARVAAVQRRWTLGLRIYLLGGGGLFLAAMTWAMVRTHARAAAQTVAQLQVDVADPNGRDQALRAVSAARKAAAWRGLSVIGVMAAGLVLTLVMLENLLWVF